MEIISLKIKSKTNPNIFIATTTRGEFSLYSDVIVQYGIKKGEVSEQTFFEAVEQSEFLIGYNLAVKYIGNKLKTEKQIKDYLYKHGFKTNQINRIVEKLLEYKLIDDCLYAQTYSRINIKFSKQKLKQKLSLAGVKKDLAESVLQDKDDFEACKKEAEKYLKNKERSKQTIEKLKRRLSGMGFSWTDISKVLDCCNFEVEDDWN